MRVSGDKNNSKKWKPWESHPSIWKSEALFWSWLRGALRGALWRNSRVKLDFKKSKCQIPPPKSYRGKARKGGICEISGKWFEVKNLEVDHIVGNVSLKSEEHILTFIKHLIPDEDALQLLSIEEHKNKSYSERYKTDVETARVKRAAIKISALNKQDLKKWFAENAPDVEIGGNASQRKKQIEEILSKEMVN